MGFVSVWQKGEKGTKKNPALIGKAKSNKVAESARSALVKGIYKEQGVAFPEHLFDDFKVGYRNMVREEIQKGERDDNSSDYITFQQYVSLAMLMPTYISSYRVVIFFVLMWNMAYRGDSMDEQFLDQSCEIKGNSGCQRKSY